MKILAIDTSTMLGGIAIMDDAGLIAESRLNVRTTHSERLMTEIEHCLKQSGLNINDMDVFAVAIGPGSFTGIRIGLSTVKGFSYATGKPVVSVPTLEALAWNFPYSRYPVCTMFDARKKEVYAALFKWEDKGFQRLMPEKTSDAGDFCRAIAGLPGCSSVASHTDRVIFAGEAALLYRDAITGVMQDKAVFASPEKMVVSPASVASLAVKKAERGDFSEPLTLAPLYLRKSEAELKWKNS